jgi:hypothetical protein
VYWVKFGNKNKLSLMVFGVKNMNRIVKGLKTYLTDWKNLLTHSIVGVIILLIALFAPVSPYIRIAFVGVVVAFNVIRMKYA